MSGLPTVTDAAQELLQEVERHRDDVRRVASKPDGTVPDPSDRRELQRLEELTARARRALGRQRMRSVTG